LKAFVTGATGFLGAHVARALSAAGSSLRLLVRESSDLRNLEGLAADRVKGDLRDLSSIEKAMEGCDAVFHVAADYRLWVRDPDEMYRSNVEGTRNVLSAARKHKVQRVVYTSSVATMGFRRDGQIVDEDSPVSLGDMIGHYKRSKYMAEQVALEAGRGGQHVVIWTSLRKSSRLTSTLASILLTLRHAPRVILEQWRREEAASDTS
jgi:dihydroflavonol-4-reductase